MLFQITQITLLLINLLLNSSHGLAFQIKFIMIREENLKVRLFSELCKLSGIEKTRTTPYRPQSDELVKRLNRTLIAILSFFVNDNRDDWDDHLPNLMMAYIFYPDGLCS